MPAFDNVFFKDTVRNTREAESSYGGISRNLLPDEIVSNINTESESSNVTITSKDVSQ
mgnify:FL=1